MRFKKLSTAVAGATLTCALALAGTSFATPAHAATLQSHNVLHVHVALPTGGQGGGGGAGGNSGYVPNGNFYTYGGTSYAGAGGGGGGAGGSGGGIYGNGGGGGVGGVGGIGGAGAYTISNGVPFINPGDGGAGGVGGAGGNSGYFGQGGFGGAGGGGGAVGPWIGY